MKNNGDDVQYGWDLNALMHALNIESKNVTDVELRAVKEMLRKYDNVFSMGDFDLGCTDLIKHRMDTGETKPIKQSLRRVPVHQQYDFDAHLQVMLDKGIVQPSNSPWEAPVVLVKKKDGTLKILRGL